MKLSERLAEARNSLTYRTEGGILDFTDELIRLMNEQNMSRADLAAAIGSSPAYITKVLGGNANFTLTTMNKLAQPLGAVVNVKLIPDDNQPPPPADTINRQFSARVCNVASPSTQLLHPAHSDLQIVSFSQTTVA